MDEKELYLRAYMAFKDLCEQGKQPSSFFVYCQKNGISYQRLRDVLKDEYNGVRDLKGYHPQKSTTVKDKFMQLYSDFKALCCNGEQPGSFAEYCEARGYDRWSVYNFLSRQGLKIKSVPGYINPALLSSKCREIPFEDVIFEEAGFLPADGGNVITVKVDGHVAVSFPADTDVAVIARFVRKMGKEVGDVGA